MKDLFTPLTRDERQEESLRAWLNHKGKGCVKINEYHKHFN